VFVLVASEVSQQKANLNVERGQGSRQWVSALSENMVGVAATQANCLFAYLNCRFNQEQAVSQSL